MKTGIEELVEKYNVAVPRYTSYPTVPYWQSNPPSVDEWLSTVKKTFINTNQTKGISLYIHLPYCESLCTYCGCNTRITVNHKVEEPYIQTLLDEWNLYLNALGEKPRIAEIHLGGGTPTFFSPKNLTHLINGILKNAELINDAELSFEGHPTNTTYEHLKTLREIGFNRVSYGIQDFDYKVQDAINRYQTFEEVKQVTEWSRELGYYSVNYDLVYGLPFQTLESVTETINKIIELKPDRIAYYSYAHVPWLKPAQRKYTEKDLPEQHSKLKLYMTGNELFSKAGYIDVGMDHFSLKEDSLTKAFENKTLHRNFMGYTTNNTSLMIGLGVSSISDSWGGFIQNYKVVEDYQKAVSEGKFPFFKGHILNEEDEWVRRHILNLVCNYETIIEENNQFSTEIKERLKSLENDHLVEVKGNKISVTSIGQRFVRNVCLAFDLKYWMAQPNKQIFSKAV